MGLVRIDTTSMWAVVPVARRLGAQPAQGMWSWGLSAGKSSPTPKIPQTTICSVLA